MAKQTIGIGAVANDGTGDPLRTAMDKVNDNFNELYNLKIYNVLNYGAVGDGATDDTTAIQNTIDAAKDGVVIIPNNTYFVTSLSLNYSTILQGTGWGDYGGGTILHSHSALPIIKINNVSGQSWSYGATLRDFQILGNSQADDASLRQTGILIDTEGDILIERVYIKYCGDYAIRLGNDYHVSKVNIFACRFQLNTKGGIYGRTVSSKQVNAISILNNEISNNYSHGIDLVGTNVKIRDNIIQGNDGCGIFMSAADLGDVTCNSYNTVIEGNYIEENKGGNIYMEYWYDNGIQFHVKTRINNNFLYLNTSTITKEGVTAHITTTDASGAVETYGFRNFFLGNGNEFTGTAPCFDGNDVLDYTALIEVTRQYGSLATYYTNIDNATISIEGVSFAPPINIGHVPVTGITADQLHSATQLTMTSPINITTNPQIVAGYQGQLINIIGNSDINTLTLETGNGLSLDVSKGPMVLTNNDVITLMYRVNTWIEISRSTN